MAELVRRLTDQYQASVVGFDVVFAEPDASSGLQVLEAIGRQQLKDNPEYQRTVRDLRPQLDYDQLFADTLRGQPVVLGFYFSGKNTQQTGILPPPALAAQAFAGRAVSFVSWDGYGGNLPKFQQAAAGGGHFNPMVEPDGVYRRVPMLVEFHGEYYEALSLAVLRVLLGADELRPGPLENDQGVEWLDLIAAQGSVRIPVDEHVAALIPYRGYERSFVYISAAVSYTHLTLPTSDLV